MTKKLKVANLPLGVNDSDLEAIFAPHGTVNSAHVFTDPDTGGSQGYGLVEMATEDQSHAAISAGTATETRSPSTKTGHRKKTWW